MPTIRTTCPAPKAHAKPVIVIDAGHGGVDPGAASGEVLEKDVVLAVARHLRTILAAKGRYDVHMTRASDVFVSLDRRLAISRAEGREPVHLHPCRHGRVRRNSRRACAARPSTRCRSRPPASRPSCWPTRRTPPTSWPASRRGRGGGVDQVKSILIDLMRRETANFSAEFRGAPAVAPEAHDRAVARSGPLGSVQGAQAAAVALGADRARLHEQRPGCAPAGLAGLAAAGRAFDRGGRRRVFRQARCPQALTDPRRG